MKDQLPAGQFTGSADVDCDFDTDNTCDQCGGDGMIMLSDAGAGVWGEDTFCDIDRPITCPTCGGGGTV
jgi:hypothetical protein